MNRRLSLLHVLVVSSLAAALLAAPAQAAGRTAAPIDYVALGDSYSAGTGAPGTTGACSRSDSGYPALWARQTGARLRLVACGGATIDDVRRTQLSALDERTDLVTVTIGGNDAGFIPALVSCALASDRRCAQIVRLARAYISGVLAGRLDSVYAAVRQRAPGARVVVLGYPRLFEETDRCPGPFSAAKRRALNAGANHLADVTRARAQAAGFRFVDVRPVFAGHSVCATDPWIHRFSLLRPTDSMHPNRDGYALGYLPALTAAAG